MRTRNTIGILGLLLLLVLVLAACGGAAAPEPTATEPPAPTDEPEPTNTPAPTVDVASLPVEDLEATLTALEEELAMAEGAASGAAGEAAESQAEANLRSIENRIEEVQVLIAEALGGEEAGDEPGDAGDAEAEDMDAVTLTLSGDFEESRQWTWEEMEALDTITATVAGPRDNDPEAEYTGVSLTAFLEAAGLGAEAETLMVTAADDFSVGIDLAAARECQECMIVLEEGVLRLIMPDFPSNNWVGDVVSLEAQ